MLNLEEWIDKQFGKLTVIGIGTKIGDRTYLTCKCACGTIKDIKPSNLSNGQSTSCGCNRNEAAARMGKANKGSKRVQEIVMTEGTPRLVYKTIFPNGKIYVGQDITNSLLYFGSPSMKVINQDFPWEERQTFSLTREIIWSSETATPEEVNEKEIEFILKLKANDPKIGYNLRPKYHREAS